MAPAAQDGDTTRPRTPQPDYSLDSVYYFHRDHLGGTLTVTDGAGAPVQQVEYTPWGEVFVELHNGNSGFTTPYLFNGKELDEETGLYYYGARYYDPKMSVWYSVDRFAEKYPYVSPYNYGANNPYGFIDVNGDTVRAVSIISGYRLLNEIHNTFQGDCFDLLNSLFNLSSDGKTMQGISKSQFVKAIKGLNADERALAYGYFNAINSNKVHIFDMTKRNEQLHQITKNHFVSMNWQTGADVDRQMGGGVNTEYSNNGSITIIVIGSIAEVDYVYGANGHHYKRFSTPAELLAHELLGHGYSRSINSKTYRHDDAIQLTNLYWRVRGYSGFFRDGTDHGTVYGVLSRTKATSIPVFLKY